MEEYETYLQGLVHGKSRVVELGERKGSMTTEHYVLVDGHPILIYVIEPEVDS